MKLNIINHQTELKTPRQFLLLWMAGLANEIKSAIRKDLRKKELTLVFLTSSQMKSINSEFRKKNYATDVLSFESVEEESLGELLLCPSVIDSQAKENGHTYKAELGYMLIHGVLHLLGYDHEKSKSAAKEMFALQDQIFDNLCRKFKI